MFPSDPLPITRRLKSTTLSSPRFLMKLVMIVHQLLGSGFPYVLTLISHLLITRDHLLHTMLTTLQYSLDLPYSTLQYTLARLVLISNPTRWWPTAGRRSATKDDTISCPLFQSKWNGFIHRTVKFLMEGDQLKVDTRRMGESYITPLRM